MPFSFLTMALGFLEMRLTSKRFGKFFLNFKFCTLMFLIRIFSFILFSSINKRFFPRRSAKSFSSVREQLNPFWVHATFFILKKSVLKIRNKRLAGKKRMKAPKKKTLTLGFFLMVKSFNKSGYFLRGIQPN